MTEEAAGVDPYEAAIADLRTKRAEIDNAIAFLTGLQRMWGRTTLSVGGSPNNATPADNAIVETPGMFLDMSIVDAAKKLLAARKRAMPNAEILSELKAGGLVLTGADPVNVVSSVLTRRFNNVGDVVRVSRGVWGLKEWYPGRNFKAASKVSATVDAIIEEAASHTIQVNDLGGSGEDDDL